MDVGSNSVSVASSFKFQCDLSKNCGGEICSSDVVTQAFERYSKMVKPSSIQSSLDAQIELINVCIASTDLTLGPRTNESYTLTVGESGSSEGYVTAATVYGMLHALETFSQLVDTTKGFTMTNAPVSIVDFPRFGFRGLLIDTGRHFLPVEKIRQIIDGLHMNRLNVLHWHIVDIQSFPCGSDKYPELAAKGAYSPKAIYSTQDLRDLVEYAKLRGVRIMPEWDIPGHGSWGHGMPSIMGCDVVLDPTQDATYDFLNSFFSEMMTIFGDEYVFLGGDEVQSSCWDQNANVSRWLKANNMTSSELQQYFWQQVTKRVAPKSLAGRTLSIWEADGLQIDPADLPSGTVANVYQSKATADITVGTHRMPTILSMAGNHWYLDGQCPGYNWNAWECVYLQEPTSNVTAGSSLLLGGEGSMWGEGINKDNFDAYVWHSEAAIAERLWSDPKSTQTTAAAQPRLAEAMCRMSLRGFKPGPIFPGFCESDL
eukprot:g1699.t1